VSDLLWIAGCIVVVVVCVLAFLVAVMM